MKQASESDTCKYYIGLKLNKLLREEGLSWFLYRLIFVDYSSWKLSDANTNWFR